MQIQKIQSSSFNGKQRFITHAMQDNINILMDKMNEGTEYHSDGLNFVTTIFKEISTKDKKVRFQDGRIYFGDKLKRKSLKKEALLTIGKTELVIDNKTGEIIDYYKPFFTTWKSIMKKIEKYLNFFRENFDNSEVVEQRKLTVSGFTKKGFERFEKLKAKLNG